jgi:uncharacterized flavoprotein (TIGR03862 family)
VEALVVGAGPAGLMAAEVLTEAGHKVIVADASPSPARKFLLAGRGGLNLTHSEPLDRFLERYGRASERLRPAIAAFAPEALRAWSAALGEPTFVGSSGRVFPRSFKSTPLLRAWLRRLEALGVELRTRHRLIEFASNEARFVTPDGDRVLSAGAIVLALGGASWPRLGSDGGWTQFMRAAGIAVAPLQPANSGFRIQWSAHFRERFAGAPLKAMRWTHGDNRSRGEAMVIADGLEGGAIYALSSGLRAAIERDGSAMLELDFKPDVPAEALARRLARPPGQSLSTFLRKAAALPPVAIALLREAGPVPDEATELAARLKACPLRITGVAPIARAISSAGGVEWTEIDESFMLRARPGVFVAGEMIDWEAPTGGYLLQGAFATGAAAGSGAARWLDSPSLFAGEVANGHSACPGRERSVPTGRD